MWLFSQCIEVSISIFQIICLIVMRKYNSISKNSTEWYLDQSSTTYSFHPIQLSRLTDEYCSSIWLFTRLQRWLITLTTPNWLYHNPNSYYIQFYELLKLVFLYSGRRWSHGYKTITCQWSIHWSGIFSLIWYFEPKVSWLEFWFPYIYSSEYLWISLNIWFSELSSVE